MSNQETIEDHPKTHNGCVNFIAGVEAIISEEFPESGYWVEKINAEWTSAMIRSACEDYSIKYVEKQSAQSNEPIKKAA